MPNGSGTLADPFNNIPAALAAAVPGDLVRVVGNGGLDDLLDTAGDNLAYEIGTGGPLDQTLSDGMQLNVPRDVTLMIDAGALFKLRGARIGVGSSPSSIDRSYGALQVLGIPDQQVIFTSYHDQSLGVDTNPLQTTPVRGDWGGLEFRHDVDTANGRLSAERQGIFLDYVNHAQIQYGGGQVLVDSELRVIDAIHIIDARPTVSYNRLTENADSAISATPDSFEETQLQHRAVPVPGRVHRRLRADRPRIRRQLDRRQLDECRHLEHQSGGRQPTAGDDRRRPLRRHRPGLRDRREPRSGRHAQRGLPPQHAAADESGDVLDGRQSAPCRRAPTATAWCSPTPRATRAPRRPLRPPSRSAANRRITLNNLPPATTPFAGRRLYRSTRRR